jgi:hypothetical protein
MNKKEVRSAEETRQIELTVDAVDLNDLDTMEESFSPAMVTGCGCGSHCGAA